jgi:hypothetical protein
VARKDFTYMIAELLLGGAVRQPGQLRRSEQPREES